MRVAVVGAGIAGLSVAYALRDVAHVTVYERQGQFGGHAHTVEIDNEGAVIAVDVGFIVFNELNYPNLTSLFRELNVRTQPSRMSFSVAHGRIEWCGKSDRPISGLFAQRRNALSPAFWGMLYELVRFQRQSLSDLRADRVGQGSLGDYLAHHGFSRLFCEAVLIPMGAAIWSASPSAVLAFPALTFLTFFDNHRLLHRRRPLWRTVTGGSRRYVETMIQVSRPVERAGVGVARVRRGESQVEVTDAKGERDSFDHVVLATHAPQALAMLCDPSERERRILAGFRTADNVAYLHRDASVMPRRRAAWAAWNVRSTPGCSTSPVSVTYWMNRLQGLDPARPLFVSLNPAVLPAPEHTLGRYAFAHPLFDRDAGMARERLSSIQGSGGVWFCGAWAGYGFHEDGLVSGLRVAEALGGNVSWRPGRNRGPERAAA